MTYNTGMIERPMSRPEGRDVWGAGLFAGGVAAIAMGVVMMAVAVGDGADALSPMRHIAGVFAGTSAISAGVGAGLLGVAIHLAVGMVFGVVFAAIIPRELSGLAKLGSGVLYGLAVFALMTFLVLPWVAPYMYNDLAIGWFLVAHLVYALTLVGVMTLTRRRLHVFRREPAL